MPRENIRQRLHDAVHRGGGKVTEDELAEVTAAVLVVAGELIAELVEVIAELEARVDALEAR
jgi:hypothetical protein